MKTYRHLRAGCNAIVGVFFGLGTTTSESKLWRVRDDEGVFYRPLVGSMAATWCPDCGARFPPIRPLVIERRAGIDIEDPRTIEDNARRTGIMKKMQAETLRLIVDQLSPEQRLAESIARQQRAFTTKE